MSFLPTDLFAPERGAVARCYQSLQVFVFFVSLALLSGCASFAPSDAVTAAASDTSGRIYAAGIQFYTETDDGVYLLLADHTFPIRRGWGEFGGATDAGETPAQTATREAEEETRGYFKRENLLERIAGQEPVLNGGYAFYFVKINKVPVEDIGNYPVHGVKLAYRERGPYAWVPYSEIERYLDAELPQGTSRHTINSEYLPMARWWHTDWFWPALFSNLRAARAVDAIPWEASQPSG